MPGDTTTGNVSNLIVTTTGGTLNFVNVSQTPPDENIGAILDSVSVATTPEPPSLVLLGSAMLAGCGVLALRRRQGFLALEKL